MQDHFRLDGVKKIEHVMPVSCCQLADANGVRCDCTPKVPHFKLNKRTRLRFWWNDRRENIAYRIAPWLKEEDDW